MNKKIYLCLIATMTMLMAWTKADAQYHITGHTLYNQCNYINGTVTSDAPNNLPNLDMTLEYGDGNSDLFTGDSSMVYYAHGYTTYGNYTIKATLIYNGDHIDSTTFSYNNTSCDEYQLTLFQDINGNCAYDGGIDYALLNNPATVQIDSDGVTVNTVTFTGSLFYAETGPVGTVYTYTVLTAPTSYTACGASSTTHTIATLYSYTQDYLGYNCTGNGFDLTFNGWFSAGIDGAGSHMYISNASCTPQAATVALQFDNTKYSYYYNSGGYAATVSGNTVTFDVGTVTANAQVVFYALFHPIGILGLGDHVTSTWTVYPLAGDANPLNNVQTEVDSLGVSHDPNGKGVYPTGIITAGTKLKYSVGFENTGTATAQNIHIMDTLDANLDASTLAITSSSHKVATQFIHNGNQTIVKFDFANINLLDSTHHGLCDGMITYTIKTKTGLTNGTKIDNRAGIYFDANEVVMTNTTVNTIGIPTGVAVMSNAAVSVYPNPVNDMLTISTEANAYNSLQIVNTLGQVIMSQAINSTKTNVSVKTLPAGMYYLTLKGENSVKTQKFEKL